MFSRDPVIEHDAIVGDDMEIFCTEQEKETLRILARGLPNGFDIPVGARNIRADLGLLAKKVLEIIEAMEGHHER